MKEKILASAWDSNKQQVKGRSLEIHSINTDIENVKAEVRQKFRNLIDSGALVTANILRDDYLNIQAKLKGHTLNELLDYYAKIWQSKLKAGGFKNDKTTISYLKKFVEFKYSKRELYLSQIDLTFATDFEHYVKFNPQKSHDPCEGNGLGKHMQRFKRIMNWATHDL